MNNLDVRKAYVDFFTDSVRKHKCISAAPLVLQDDATTLFTSSGMQPLVPFLSGREEHVSGKRLVNVQPCIRTQDIDEVGDNRHTTYFEMLGNWSLGDYYKREQLAWVWEFFTRTLMLPIERLHITIFEGTPEIPKDDEAETIWIDLGVPQDHIWKYGVKSNWWSRSGPPDLMPVGEIGGPSSEIFYDYGEGPHNGPASDEERFLEIGNSVFIAYCKHASGTLTPLDQKNVDFGGGYERIVAACAHEQDIFRTSVFDELVNAICSVTGATYSDPRCTRAIRIIADHIRSASHLIIDGVVPAHKEHGYIVRRMLRRMIVQMRQLQNDAHKLEQIVAQWNTDEITSEQKETIKTVIAAEIKRFEASLQRGMKVMEKAKKIDENLAFDLFQSYGFPFDVTRDFASERGISLDEALFGKIMDSHKERSRTASVGKFKGGLAEESDQVIKYHTATHLLQQALRDVFGETIRQEGSNITSDRLRFDTRIDHKPTDDEMKTVEKRINEKIKENLLVHKHVLPLKKAEAYGAIAFFKEKYDDTVSMYTIGVTDDPATAYSKELCGGPHVARTGVIGDLTIYKWEKIGAHTLRIYAR